MSKRQANLCQNYYSNTSGLSFLQYLQIVKICEHIFLLKQKAIDEFCIVYDVNVYNLNRCMKWVINLNNKKLDALFEKDWQKLKNHKVCSVHFNDRDYSNQERSRLLKSAVPQLSKEKQ